MNEKLNGSVLVGNNPSPAMRKILPELTKAKKKKNYKKKKKK